MRLSALRYKWLHLQASTLFNIPQYLHHKLTSYATYKLPSGTTRTTLLSIKKVTAPLHHKLLRRPTYIPHLSVDQLKQKIALYGLPGGPCVFLHEAKQGKQPKKIQIQSLWERSIARAWGESRFDETCIKKLQIVVFQTLQMKKQIITGYSSMIGEHLICWVTNLEHGLRIASVDKTVNWIWLEEKFHPL